MNEEQLAAITKQALINTLRDLANAKEGDIINEKVLKEIYENKAKEIERLNNIINELEKWLWEERFNHHGEYVLSGRKAEDIYTLILDKIKKLKENKK